MAESIPSFANTTLGLSKPIPDFADRISGFINHIHAFSKAFQTLFRVLEIIIKQPAAGADGGMVVMVRNLTSDLWSAGTYPFNAPRRQGMYPRIQSVCPYKAQLMLSFFTSNFVYDHLDDQALPIQSLIISSFLTYAKKERDGPILLMQKPASYTIFKPHGLCNVKYMWQVS